MVLYIICHERKNEDEKIFKEEDSIGILKVLGWIEHIKLLQKYDWKNISRQYALQYIDEIRNYIIG